MTKIHPTAIVDSKAELASNVEVGPFCVIESNVTIDSGCKLGPYVHIQGETHIGKDNTIGTGTALGQAPQHAAYKGEPRRLIIGDGNTIREYASVHGSWEKDGATRIGNHCFIMGQCHIGHDCVVEDEVVLSNGALISGHTQIGSGTVISGPVGVHQFVRIGRLVMVSTFSGVGRDVPPFMIIEGRPNFIRGLNSVGLKRAGISSHSRLELRRVFRALYRGGKPVQEAVAELRETDLGPEARELVDFYQPSKRGITPFAAYKSD